jgi:hypothetical protein
MFKKYYEFARRYGIRNLASEVKAEFDIGRLAVGIIVAVVVIVIAVALVPTIMGGVLNAKTGGYNVTSTNSTGATIHTFHSFSSLFPSATALLIIIPLIFVAGILVIILYMLFTKE